MFIHWVGSDNPEKNHQRSYGTTYAGIPESAIIIKIEIGSYPDPTVTKYLDYKEKSYPRRLHLNRTDDDTGKMEKLKEFIASIPHNSTLLLYTYANPTHPFLYRALVCSDDEVYNEPCVYKSGTLLRVLQNETKNSLIFAPYFSAAILSIQVLTLPDNCNSDSLGSRVRWLTFEQLANLD